MPHPVFVDSTAPEKANARTYLTLRLGDANALRALDPQGAWFCFVDALGAEYRRDASDTTSADDGVNVIIDAAAGRWKRVSTVSLSPFGGTLSVLAKTEELTLSGTFVETADAAFIPDRAIVLGVASRTTQAITGATSYRVGTAAENAKFGDLLGIALNSTNIGVISPTAYYANTKVRVTRNGSNFTGGKVRLIISYLALSAPTS
jgi:hypothetical protein